LNRKGGGTGPSLLQNSAIKKRRVSGSYVQKGFFFHLLRSHAVWQSFTRLLPHRSATLVFAGTKNTPFHVVAVVVVVWGQLLF